jgi:S-methylmethionine-dependent homocysteine/selenocysteine methylase
MTVLDGFRQRLSAGDVIVIDGGMGAELGRRGVPMHPIAWFAPAVLEHYDTVRTTHEDYIRAGAEVIIANTFLAGYETLTEAGLANRAAEINRLSIEAAREARDNAADRPVLIAGALLTGYPGDEVKASLRDPKPDVEYISSCVREQATVIAEAGADLMALEMIQSTVWGQVATNVVAEIGLPVWLGVSYGYLKFEDGPDVIYPNDPPGRAGDLVNQILTSSTPNADVMAVNVMHTELDDVASTLDQIEPYWGGVLGVYPHHGTQLHEPPSFLPLPVEPANFVALARQWVERGVQIIGGCCGIGPEHIRALRDELPPRIPEGVRRVGGA